jgi:steroid 5-alpha reductase family enzyme
MKTKRFLEFAGRFTVVLVVTTFAVGMVTYPLLTKGLFESPDSAFARLFRTQADPELWKAVYIWVLPIQIIRGLLIAAVIYPFYGTLNTWSYWKRFIAIAGLLVGLGHLAGSSGVIEGWYMLRPEFVTWDITLRTLPEPIVQGILISAWAAK